eukprot:379567-Hanusia_phi.AAC.8
MGGGKESSRVAGEKIFSDEEVEEKLNVQGFELVRKLDRKSAQEEQEIGGARERREGRGGGRGGRGGRGGGRGGRGEGGGGGGGHLPSWYCSHTLRRTLEERSRPTSAVSSCSEEGTERPGWPR